MENLKKVYIMPKITKIKLVVKDSVLASCHASPNLTPRRSTGCNIETTCWDGPGH